MRDKMRDTMRGRARSTHSMVWLTGLAGFLGPLAMLQVVRAQSTQIQSTRTQATQTQATRTQAISAEGIVIRVMQHDAQRRLALAEYASERNYHMEYKGPIGERQAQMRVRMEFSAPDRKRFTVVSESGSTIFCHQVLRKLMEGEQEGALEANHLRSMLSPANYHLKLAREDVLDGLSAWVLEVTPVEDSKFSYKGKVWVSKDDYAIMRIVGSPAKNPSWLMGNSSFDYRYARTGEFWLPERNETVSHLRIGGEIKLTVDYGQYRIVAALQPDGTVPATGPGSNLRAAKAAPRGVAGLAVSLP